MPIDTDQTASGKELTTAFVSRSTLTRYLLALFAVSLLLYPLPFYLVRLPSYREWNRSPSFRLLDFGFNAAGQNADVVIFGDSSAYVGIDPSSMSAALGAKVLTLPGNLGGLKVFDDMPLRRYLQADKPPKLIVFYFAPWDFDYRRDSELGPTYDGMEMLLRYGAAGEILAFAETHPLFTMQFPLMFYRANISVDILAGAKYRRQAERLALTNGHEEAPAGVPFSSTCVIPSKLIDKIRFDSVRELTEKYRTPETQVMYFAAPVPGCINAREAIDRASSVLSVTPKEVSASLFLGDPYYTHLFPDGVPQATQNLIDAVRPLLAGR